MFIKLIIVLSVLCLSCYLFKVASGTLAINKLNIVSYIFYIFLIQNFLGASIIFLGNRNHYLTKMITGQYTIDKTYFLICFTAIIFPLSIILITKIFKINIREIYSKYLEKEISLESEGNMFLIILLSTIICIILTIYMFYKIGEVPLLEIIFRNQNNLSHIRGAIGSTRGMNPYIQNLVVLGLTPTLSVIAFLFARVTKKKSWIILFGVLFVACIFIKTYNGAKSPVIFYLVTFLFVDIIVNGVISFKKIFSLGIVSIFILLFMYVKSGYSFYGGIDIYNGPIGRTIFTQVGTLFLHIDLFPGHISFLEGRSLSPTLLNLFFDGINHVRSGKIVMEFYSPLRVYEGTAGVMNSLFIGEAFANFGLKGALIAPIYVGSLIGGVYLIFMKIRKTPINVVAYVSILMAFSTAFQGGFTDYIYNFNLIFTLVFLYAINFAAILMDKFQVFNLIKTKLKI